VFFQTWLLAFFKTTTRAWDLLSLGPPVSIPPVSIPPISSKKVSREYQILYKKTTTKKEKHRNLFSILIAAKYRENCWIAFDISAFIRERTTS
jgi:hypothetical protein